MFNRLNGWERIGVVITALWLIYVLFLGAIGISGGKPFGKTLPGSEETTIIAAKCSKPWPEKKPGETISMEEAMGQCAPGAIEISPVTSNKQIFPDKHEFFYGAFFAAVFLPPLFFWFLAYTSVRVVKWVAKGFRGKAT
jgi:hypothetical protein